MTNRPDNFNAYATEIHELNHKWWYAESGARLDRNVGELLMLQVSELAECMEAERTDATDDKLPHRKGAEVEMADFIIRIMDLSGASELDISYYLDDNFENMHGIPSNKADCLYRIVEQHNGLQSDLEEKRSDQASYKVSLLIKMAESYCTEFGYDLWSAVAEKLEYNKTRTDHSYEERAKDGGKKF